MPARKASKDEIKQSIQKWDKTVLEPVLKKYSERRSRFSTSSGIEKRRLYKPDDTLDQDYLKEVGFPGQYPFTRGIQPTMYRGKLWTMRQYSGFGTAEESNLRFKYLLDQGQTGLSVAFDLPTQMGYDSDAPISEGAVGKVGVAIDSLEDMEALLKDIPLDKVSCSMTINAPAAILLAMYECVAEKQNIEGNKLSGTIQNDILKEYIARGTYIFPPKPSMRIITDIFTYCAEHLPSWNTISISGYHIREAGSTAAQEIGFTIANGIAYVNAAIETGLEIDSFAPRLSFFFNVHNDMFEEIAKFRAARRIWAKIMKNRFGCKNPDSLKLRFHAQTGGSTLTAQQPDNNIARVALQALTAIAGGAQSLHTNSLDEALALPTEHTARIALRTQQIIAYESGVAEVVDPVGGSYYVESLTNELEKEAVRYIDTIDEMGGMVRAIETGYVQKEIQQSAYKQQIDIENKNMIIVGLNDFQSEDHQTFETLKIDKSVQAVQIKKVHALRSRRDNTLVDKCLAKLKICAEGNDNIMPAIVKSVKCYTTVGEICEILRSVFGTYVERSTI